MRMPPVEEADRVHVHVNSTAQYTDRYVPESENAAGRGCAVRLTRGWTCPARLGARRALTLRGGAGGRVALAQLAEAGRAAAAGDGRPAPPVLLPQGRAAGRDLLGGGDAAGQAGDAPAAAAAGHRHLGRPGLLRGRRESERGGGSSAATKHGNSEKRTASPMILCESCRCPGQIGSLEPILLMSHLTRALITLLFHLTHKSPREEQLKRIQSRACAHLGLTVPRNTK